MIRVIVFVTLCFSGKVWADISFENAWVRLLPPSVTTTAAYMTITSDQDDVLIRASSPDVEMVELHLSSMTDGVMSMDHVDTIEIKAAQPLELSPGSYHLMLMGLKKKLKEDDSFQLRLVFEKAGELELSLPVKR
jgi:copper(I)-binding protein